MARRRSPEIALVVSRGEVTPEGPDLDWICIAAFNKMPENLQPSVHLHYTMDNPRRLPKAITGTPQVYLYGSRRYLPVGVESANAWLSWLSDKGVSVDADAMAAAVAPPEKEEVPQGSQRVEVSDEEEGAMSDEALEEASKRRQELIKKIRGH